VRHGSDRYRDAVAVLYPRHLRLLPHPRLQHHAEATPHVQLDTGVRVRDRVMGSFVAAWLVGEGIITYRSVKKNHAPPIPGELLLSSGVFVLLGLLAESDKARVLAVTLAWGYDLAAFMNLFGTGAPSLFKAGNVIPWPPGAASNTLVFPDGKTASASPNTSSAPAQTTPSGPVTA